MIPRRLVVFALAVLGAATAWGQANRREPNLGYLYPAGGQQGTTVRIDIGGAVITSSITNAAVEELGLKVGEPGYAVIKASDVMVGRD